jgi:hypothetical protein
MVTNVRPGENCTLSIACVAENSVILQPRGADHDAPHASAVVHAQIEYGDTKGFTKIGEATWLKK